MKKYKEVFPCGVLTIGDRAYWLLHPEPVQADDWQHNFQQRFVVTPFSIKGRQVNENEVTDDGDFYSFPFYDYARHIVCTNPVIEYWNVKEPIHILQVEEEYNRIPEPEPNEPEPEDLKIAQDLFLKEVGAMPDDDYSDKNKHALDYLNDQYN